MVVKKSPPVTPSEIHLPKGSPHAADDSASSPSVPRDGSATVMTHASQSTFVPTAPPHAPQIPASPPSIVARNPFGPEFFAELDTPSPPADEATLQALNDPLFNRGPTAPLTASEAARLLGYLRQD